jgi:hypothetical protein
MAPSSHTNPCSNSRNPAPCALRPLVPEVHHAPGAVQEPVAAPVRQRRDADDVTEVVETGGLAGQPAEGPEVHK